MNYLKYIGPAIMVLSLGLLIYFTTNKEDTDDYFTYYSWTKLTGRFEITHEEWKHLKAAGFLHNNARYE